MFKLSFDGPDISKLDCDKVLKGWHTLSCTLPSLNDPHELMTLIRYELTHKNREQMLQRMISRVVSLHTATIRKELEEYARNYNKEFTTERAEAEPKLEDDIEIEEG